MLFTALFKVVSSVLQFGNMAFKQERSSEQAIMPSNEGKTKTAKENSQVWHLNKRLCLMFSGFLVGFIEYVFSQLPRKFAICLESQSQNFPKLCLDPE